MGPYGMGRYGMGMRYPMYGMGMYPGMGFGMLRDEQSGESSSVMPDKTIEDQFPMENSEGTSDIIGHEKLTAFSEQAKE